MVTEKEWKEVVDQLIQARKEKGWSQQKLAEKIGIYQGTVSNWERCQRRPAQHDHLSLWGSLLGVDVTYIQENLEPRAPSHLRRLTPRQRSELQMKTLRENQDNPEVRRLMLEAAQERRRQGLNLAEIQRRCGHQVNTWEKGTVTPLIDSFIVYLETLDLQIALIPRGALEYYSIDPEFYEMQDDPDPEE